MSSSMLCMRIVSRFLSCMRVDIFTEGKGGKDVV